MPKAAFNGSSVTCSQVDQDGSGNQYTHVPQTLVATAVTVFINNNKAALKGDTSKCAPAFPTSPSISSVQDGSSSVKIEGKSAARVGDKTNHLQGKITSGSSNVTIG